MSDTLKLLQRIDYKLPQYLVDAKSTYEIADSQYKVAETVRADKLKYLQNSCSHFIVLESKGGYGYSAGGIRVCYICGLQEAQPMTDPGDEYNFGSYGDYKILTEYGIRPDGTLHFGQRNNREFYQVERNEIYAIRKY